MPRVWGGEDITRDKTVFVWPSGAARNDKVDMKNLTFWPGMSEREVKQMLIEEFDLDCEPDSIMGLVDGYNQLCEKLSDIATNRKGYHIRFSDERGVELSQLRKENASLREQLAARGSGGSSSELEQLRKENEKLRSENSRLKRELNQAEGLTSRSSAGSSSKPSSNASSSLAEQARDKGRRSSLEDRAAKLQPKASNSSRAARIDRAAPAEAAAKAPRKQPSGSGVAQGVRVQDIALPVPLSSDQGTKNYEKLQKAWLEGCDDEPLDPPDELEDHIDDLLLADKPKYIKEAVPLDCLLDALADQWMRDNVL